jgi:hypothetical protein
MAVIAGYRLAMLLDAIVVLIVIAPADLPDT